MLTLVKGPYKTKRCGMRVIRADFANELQSSFVEVITNAYGAGYINDSPDCVTPEIWEKIVEESKILEQSKSAW